MWVWTGSGDDFVDGGDGNDHVTLGSGDDVALLGAGDDFGDGGSGDDILIGADGNDRIYGGHGDDILIGGIGRDRIYGGHGSDLLIAGRTVFDNDLAALDSIFGEWTSNQSYQTRVEHLRSGTGSHLNGIALVSESTVFGDSNRDKLKGDHGQDWFFASLNDRVYDQSWWEDRDVLVDF